MTGVGGRALRPAAEAVPGQFSALPAALVKPRLVERPDHVAELDARWWSSVLAGVAHMLRCCLRAIAIAAATSCTAGSSISGSRSRSHGASRSRRVPKITTIVEHGLERLLVDGLRSGASRFVTGAAAAVRGAEVVTSA